MRTIGVLCAAALLIAGIHAAAVRGLADAHYTSARLTLAAGSPAGRAPRLLQQHQREQSERLRFRQRVPAGVRAARP